MPQYRGHFGLKYTLMRSQNLPPHHIRMEKVDLKLVGAISNFHFNLSLLKELHLQDSFLLLFESPECLECIP
jgi:hypothetical protein